MEINTSGGRRDKEAYITGTKREQSAQQKTEKGLINSQPHTCDQVLLFLHTRPLLVPLSPSCPLHGYLYRLCGRPSVCMQIFMYHPIPISIYQPSTYSFLHQSIYPSGNL